MESADGKKALKIFPSFRVTVNDGTNQRQVVATGEKLPEKAEKILTNPLRLDLGQPITEPRARQFRHSRHNDEVILQANFPSAVALNVLY